MLDEIINHVQSLQRQVEVTVNIPCTTCKFEMSISILAVNKQFLSPNLVSVR